jgi:hypothetical protein
MRWRKWTYYLLWLTSVLLMVSSQVFKELDFIDEHIFSIVLIIGFFGSILLLFDAKDMKKRVLENIEKKYSRDDGEDSKKQK